MLLESWIQYAYYGLPLTISMWIEFTVLSIGTYLIGAISIKNPAFEISVYSIIVNINLFLYLSKFWWRRKNFDDEESCHFDNGTSVSCTVVPNFSVNSRRVCVGIHIHFR